MAEIYTILSSLEKDEHIHLGRLLILLQAFSGEKESGEIEGLTKLAKLDFLLRYPVYLERALIANGKEMKKFGPHDYERKSVEAKMVRYRYGPWDFRYRRFINTLIGMNLVYIRQQGRSFYVGITPKGSEIAEILVSEEAVGEIAERAKIIKSNFNRTGTWLMKFIYKTFPEIGSLQYGKEIV